MSVEREFGAADRRRLQMVVARHVSPERTRMRKAVGSVQKTLGRCELENITAVSPQDCAVAGAEKITKAQAKVDSVIGKCSDTAGLQGCRFEMMADPACLGTSALSMEADLPIARSASCPSAEIADHPTRLS